MQDELQTSPLDIVPILKQEFPLDVKDLKISESKKDPDGRHIFKGLITDKKAFSYIMQAIGVTQQDIDHSQCNNYSGGTAHPVHRTAANAIQFQID